MCVHVHGVHCDWIITFTGVDVRLPSNYCRMMLNSIDNRSYIYIFFQFSMTLLISTQTYNYSGKNMLILNAHLLCMQLYQKFSFFRREVFPWFIKQLVIKPLVTTVRPSTGFIAMFHHLVRRDSRRMRTLISNACGRC